MPSSRVALVEAPQPRTRLLTDHGGTVARIAAVAAATGAVGWLVGAAAAADAAAAAVAAVGKRHIGGRISLARCSPGEGWAEVVASVVGEPQVHAGRRAGGVATVEVLSQDAH